MIYPVHSTIHLLNNRGLGPVVQKLDSAILRIAQLVFLILIRGIVIYPVDSAIHLLNNRGLGPVVQKVDSAIHRINHYPADSAIGFPNTYPQDTDLSGR